MIVSRFPYPLEKGDKLRAFHQLRELSKEFNVTLFAITDHEPKAENLEAVAPYCKNMSGFKLLPATFLGTFSGPNIGVTTLRRYCSYSLPARSGDDIKKSRFLYLETRFKNHLSSSDLCSL